MGNDDERFTDNCGWPGNERVTVSMIIIIIVFSITFCFTGGILHFELIEYFMFVAR